MKSQKEYIELIREYYENTARKNGVTKMALFGSVARNEQQEDSDIDIAYEGQANLFNRIRMKINLDDADEIFQVAQKDLPVPLSVIQRMKEELY